MQATIPTARILHIYILDLLLLDSKIANEDSSLFGNLPELKAVKRKSESEDENQPSQKRKLHGNGKFLL